MKRLPIVFFVVALLAGCFIDDGLRALRVACGFADVVVKEMNFVKIDKAISGPESAGTKVCRAARAYTEKMSDEGIGGVPQGEVMLQLPTGDTVPLEIRFR